jgi:hypothetical protein
MLRTGPETVPRCGRAPDGDSVAVTTRDHSTENPSRAVAPTARPGGFSATVVQWPGAGMPRPGR